MRNGNTLLGVLNNKSGRIGAGGFTTSIRIANNGTAICRTDTHNAYVLPAGGSTWQQQIKPGVNVTAAQLDLFYGTASPWGQCGTYDAAIAPSNSQVRAIILMGYCWITQDGGATYTRSALPQQANCMPNEAERGSGNMLAFDPADPGTLIFGGPNGAFITHDYGATWTAISTATLPAPTAGRRTCVAFDPSSAVTGGKTQGIWVFINGTGLRHTTDGGATWTTPTQPTNNPTGASHMRVGSNGYVYLAGDGTAGGQGRFRRLAAGVWTEPAGVNCKTVAVSPHNAGHVYIGSPGGGLDFSSDYGATWMIGGGNTAGNLRVATNIGWQAWTNEDYMTSGDMVFDPSRNRIWVAEGCGIWYMDNPPSSGLTFSSKVTWTEFSAGVENMVSADIRVSPNYVGYSCHDRGCMIMSRNNVGVAYPATHGGIKTFQHSQACDFAPEDETFWLMSSMQGQGTTPVPNAYFYTPDAGQTWTGIAAMDATALAGGGGQVCCLSKDVWIVAPCGAGKGVWLTTNRGGSFTQLTLGDNLGLIVQNQYNLGRRVLVRDPFTAGRAVLYHVGNPDNGTSANSRGFWQIDVNLSTGVPTLTRKSSTYITAPGGYGGPDFYNGRVTPGFTAGEYFWCGGDNCLGLWRTTNGGATWAKVSGTDDQGAGTDFGEVFSFGIGKAVSGSAFPTYLAAGYRMDAPTGATNADVGKFGYWMSIDGGATWKRVAQFFANIFDSPNHIVGDPYSYGRFYIGFGGTGLWMQTYDFNLALHG